MVPKIYRDLSALGIFCLIGWEPDWGYAQLNRWKLGAGDPDWLAIGLKLIFGFSLVCSVENLQKFFSVENLQKASSPERAN